jgi:hypothetical protein
MQFKVFRDGPMFRPPHAMRLSMSCPIHPLFIKAIEVIYPRAAACGLDLFLGTYSSGPMGKENLSLSEKPENTSLKKRKGGISPL